ncbi:hypothetical protein AYO38_05820 [bacterium SCGC AG-212-C10]|nr:hypothetical protein AYO38_05820 [bacterium SCGC AG-212-C10]
MTAQPGSAREAAERNAQAVMTGNLAQIMADITPEALTQLMQLGAAASGAGLSITSMPSITGYELTDLGPDGDAEVFQATFTSDAGTATLSAKWKQILGQWKITEVAVVSAQVGGSDTPPPPPPGQPGRGW